MTSLHVSERAGSTIARAMFGVISCLLGMLVASCAGPSTTESKASSREPQYMVETESSWTLREAVRPLSPTAVAVKLDPSLDWWAEYERLIPIDGGSRGDDLRLSGHRLNVERQARDLVGFELRAIGRQNSAKCPRALQPLARSSG